MAHRERQILLEARDLRIGYGKKMVAEGITFSLREGEILVLIGQNGSGKSTLLKTAAGFLPPLGGELFLDGKRVEKMTGEDRARTLSIVTTRKPDAEWMSVWDVASSGRYPYTGRLGILTEEDRRIIRQALERMHVLDLKDRYFSELSDGQRQRVMLAKSIAQQPKVLLLDEPASFLDIGHVLELIRVCRELAAEKDMAILVSVHELGVSRLMADRILTLKNGRMDRIGTAECVLTQEYIRQLYDIPDGTDLGGIDGF